MDWLALKMLIGHRTRYLTMVFGITFASLLIAQQVSIFCGVLRMATGQIRDIEDAEVWVVGPEVRYIDDLETLSERRLSEVRSVNGVAWAVPLYKGVTRAYLAGRRFQQLLLVGLDDVSLVGAPRTMVRGSVQDLEQPDAVLVDQVGMQLLWPDQPVHVGGELTINEHRARIVGVCKTALTFQTLPLVYTRACNAANYLPPQRRNISAILVRGRPGVEVESLCRRIQGETGLLALTPQQFADRTISYYLDRTGLLANFGTTVLLGFLVGVAIAGQTFYNFTLENLAYFGTLKAMGMTNRRLIRMILLQAAVIASIGYGLGVGLAALFGELTRDHSKLVFFMPWQVLVGTGAAILLVSLLTSFVSISRVLRVEPAMIIR
jgi:putative ABC transport system permease protein